MADRSGVFTFLAGIILLVVMALGFSFFVEKRSEISTLTREAEESLAAEAGVPSALRIDLARANARLETSTREVELIKLRIEAATAILAKARDKIGRLGPRKESLRVGLVSLNEDFLKYQSDYRKATWQRAAGEKISVLKTKAGREYSQVEILSVNQGGVEIRHEHGSARVKAAECSAEWQDRFQWWPPGSRLEAN